MAFAYGSRVLGLSCTSLSSAAGGWGTHLGSGGAPGGHPRRGRLWPGGWFLGDGPHRRVGAVGEREAPPVECESHRRCSWAPHPRTGCWQKNHEHNENTLYAGPGAWQEKSSTIFHLFSAGSR